MTVKLYHGDCLDIMPTLMAGSVDAIITDLPYGTTACAWDEVIPFAPMWEQVKRVLKSNGVFITTSAQPFTSALIMSDPIYYRYEWIWSKNFGGNFGVLEYQPNRTHEHILIFGSGTLTYNPQMQRTESAEALRRSKSHGRASVIRRSKSEVSEHMPGLQRIDGIFTEFVKPKSVQYFEGVPKQHIKHPTQKPVNLYEYLIRTYTNAGETVLDICMGSGTTGVAAIQTGRNFIGIEKDKKYFDIAEKRIAGAKIPLFV